MVAISPIVVPLFSPWIILRYSLCLAHFSAPNVFLFLLSRIISVSSLRWSKSIIRSENISTIIYPLIASPHSLYCLFWDSYLKYDNFLLYPLWLLTSILYCRSPWSMGYIFWFICSYLSSYLLILSLALSNYYWTIHETFCYNTYIDPLWVLLFL